MILDEMIAAAAAEAAILLGREHDSRITAFARLHVGSLCSRLGFSADAASDDDARMLALAAGRQVAASLVAAEGGFEGRIRVGDLEIDGTSDADTALRLERGAEAIVRLIGGTPKKRIAAVGGGGA